jgi:hypothetical protein
VNFNVIGKTQFRLVRRCVLGWRDCINQYGYGSSYVNCKLKLLIKVHHWLRYERDINVQGVYYSTRERGLEGFQGKPMLFS